MPHGSPWIRKVFGSHLFPLFLLLPNLIGCVSPDLKVLPKDDLLLHSPAIQGEFFDEAGESHRLGDGRSSCGAWGGSHMVTVLDSASSCSPTLPLLSFDTACHGGRLGSKSQVVQGGPERINPLSSLIRRRPSLCFEPPEGRI